jgi:hypothetical protein
MSHRPREDDGEPDASQEERAGRLGSRRYRSARERIVGGLRIVATEPDPRAARRKLARYRIETTLPGITDLDAERARQSVERMFRDVAVAGKVPPEE